MLNDMVFIKPRLAIVGLLTAPFFRGNRENGQKHRFFPDLGQCVYDPNILWPFSYWIYFPDFDPFYDVN